MKTIDAKQADQNAKDAINAVLKTFEEGNLPKALAYCVHPKIDVPCNDYSLSNRIILALAGTADARGYACWTKIGRHVKKGGHAVRIFAPNTKTFKERDKDTGEEVKRTIVSGFRGIPVFPVEQTEGKELDYEQIPLPALPLMDVAEYLGISVKSIPANPAYYGYYQPAQDSISMATDEEAVYYHELSHAIHRRTISEEVKAKVIEGQCPIKEIVAELSSAVIGYLLNKEMPSTIGNHYQYIKSYADKQHQDVFKACLQVFGEVEAIINEIFRVSELLKNQ